MKKIITISREFGSGGRELGKRLAENLGFDYYDREIVSEVAKQKGLDEEYVEKSLEKGLSVSMPLHYGRSFTLEQSFSNIDLLVAEHKIIKAVAEKGNCIIVGRASNVILNELNPFSIFVYSDIQSKINRCKNYEKNGELTDREAEKMIKRIDSDRKKYYAMFSDKKWGCKSGYDLCVNTTDIEIKKIIPALSDYAKIYFGGNDE